MRTALCLCILVMANALAAAQQLPRHAELDFTAASLPSGTRPASPTHVVVTALTPGTQASTHVRVGDLIDAIADKTISNLDDVDSALHVLRAGQKVPITVLRDGEIVHTEVTLRSAPYESLPGIDVLYRTVRVDGSLRRVIVTKPRGNGRFPAILLIGGLGCYSLDGWSKEDAPYGRLLYTLTQHGWVTMRVEKSGEGDSRAPQCSSPEADFNLEAAGYTAGLDALRRYDFVQADHVFVFAHSIGPLVATVVAQRSPVRGMIAAETTGRVWFDYELDIAGRQMLDLGDPYDEAERNTRELEVCLHDFYIEKQTPGKLLRDHPGCRGIFVPGVPYTYLQQVGDLNPAAAWKKWIFPSLSCTVPLTPLRARRKAVIWSI